MEINRPTHTHTHNRVYVCRHVRDYRIQILTNIMPLDMETHTKHTQIYIYIYVVYVCILDIYTHISLKFMLA